MQSSKDDRAKKPVLQGTEHLVTVSQFAREKKLAHSLRKYIYQHIKAGLITPVYVGKFRDIYIDLEKYRNIKLRYLTRAEIRELKEKNNA